MNLRSATAAECARCVVVVDLDVVVDLVLDLVLDLDLVDV